MKGSEYLRNIDTGVCSCTASKQKITMWYNNQVGEPEERRRFKDRGIYKRMVLKPILKQTDVSLRD